MISGIGFQEVMFIAVLVLIFFGPKGVSGIMRDLGRFVGQIQKYRNEFTKEMLAITEVKPDIDDEKVKSNERKRIRALCVSQVKALKLEVKTKENNAIYKRLTELKEYKNASSIFCYISLSLEVQTREIIKDAISKNKKVFIPFCIKGSKKIEFSEIKDIEKDCEKGKYGILEPKDSLKEKSISFNSADILIIPGVAFDNHLTRLGKGKGYFDRFLKEVKGKKPIIALAYNVQRHPYAIPYYSHDIKPDILISPNLEQKEDEIGQK